jgi:hypothetical protein
LEQADVETHAAQSIVVRVWLEDPETDREPTHWRARMTHIPSGEARTVDSLCGIARFCAVRLLEVNARLRWYERIWLRFVRGRER